MIFYRKQNASNPAWVNWLTDPAPNAQKIEANINLATLKILNGDFVKTDVIGRWLLDHGFDPYEVLEFVQAYPNADDGWAFDSDSEGVSTTARYFNDSLYSALIADGYVGIVRYILPRHQSVTFFSETEPAFTIVNSND